MKTYYQKHKTIQATQFDGNWSTLIHLLPQEIGNRIKRQIRFKNSDFIWKMNQNHDVMWCTIDNNVEINWQPYFIKRKHRNYKHYIANERHIAKLLSQTSMSITDLTTKQETYKYQMSHRVLHMGDYIVLKWVKQLCHDNQNQRTYDFSGYQVQIWPKAEFESQWSQTPIKKGHS